MTKLTSRRWAIIFFISLALNVFLGGLLVADKYFKGHRGAGFRGNVYSMPWARRVLGDEVRPMMRQIFRERREGFRGNRRARAELYNNVSAALAKEPFDQAELRQALGALQANLQAGHTAMNDMMAEFSSKLTTDQRKQLVQAVAKWQERRRARFEHRRQRRLERQKEKQPAK
ncbi:MAG: periplasmic heavy metal sensor [Rhodospirillales bacterium]|nr:periplasmic heavy metal sensor [Rhodospirillales bacterium]